MILILNYLPRPLLQLQKVLGHTMKLFKYHVNSLTRSNFFSNRVINDWNSLPQSIADSPSVNNFDYV